MDALKPRIRLLDLDLNNFSRDEVVGQVLARGGAKPFSYVVTPNADHFARLMRIPRLRIVYASAMLCLLDSRVIRHWARALGIPVPGVVTGVDLTQALLPCLAGRRVAVIGMADAAYLALTQRYPGTEFLHHRPPMGVLHNLPAFYAARDFAGRSEADFTFIALGSPVQELLAYSIARRGEATGVALCIGAGLEFAAGTAKRAPQWMQNSGLEWAHRLGQNPRRLAGRYLLDDPVVLFALCARALERYQKESSKRFFF